MGTFIYTPHRVIDIDGISDGASIYVYETGTTTPISLYSDTALTDLVTNPYEVPLGAEVPPLYYSGNANIRVKIVSVSGAIEDMDPYPRLRLNDLDTSAGVAVGGNIVSTSSTAGVGYATGAGGTVTQVGAKSASVVLNNVCGQITMNNAALAGGGRIAFSVTNSTVAATDTIVVNVAGGGSANAYRASITAVSAGSFTITVENIAGGALSESPVLNFAVIKGVTS